jgi:hypothetical protein
VAPFPTRQGSKGRRPANTVLLEGPQILLSYILMSALRIATVSSRAVRFSPLRSTDCRVLGLLSELRTWHSLIMIACLIRPVLSLSTAHSVSAFRAERFPTRNTQPCALCLNMEGVVLLRRSGPPFELGLNLNIICFVKIHAIAF